MTRRPFAVSIVCALGALAALITAVLFAVDSLWLVPPTASQRALAYAALTATVCGLAGMWRMRRWGVLVIAALFAARVGWGLLGHAPWNLPALAGPAVILLVGVAYVRTMS
jgi:hypothetical protein